MAELTEPQKQLAEMIIEVLNLEDMGVADIDPDAQLFDGGLGLDSIDALEIAVAIAQKYNVHLKAEDEETQAIFATLRSLSEHIAAQSGAVQAEPGR
jgi:acyl carrier protein